MAKTPVEKNVPISIFYRMQKGDQFAFKQIFDTYYRHLVILAMRYVGDRDLSENIVQEVFVNLWEKREMLQIQSLQGYLVVSVRNRCQNELKHQKVVRAYETNAIPDVFQPVSEFPDEIVMNKIISVIDMLPEKRQKIFKMNKLEGMKYKEIALVMQISPKTVEIQIGKALKFLRENLASLKVKVYHEN
jgi:RNA polymerase sigma-70 factor, ECF subfamily